VSQVRHDQRSFGAVGTDAGRRTNGPAEGVGKGVDEDRERVDARITCTTSWCVFMVARSNRGAASPRPPVY
jgi:hypothetical protein